MEETNSLARSRRMGEMPEGKLLLSMAVPMMLSMLVQALYNIVDSVYVAKVSEDCLSALSLAFPAQNILIGLATGTGVGVSTMLSRALGSRDNKLANRVAGNSLFLCVCCWIIMAIFGIFFADAFIHSQTDIESIRSYGDSYLRIVTIGSVFVYFEINFERLLQSTGQTKLSMWAQIIGAVANIILDPFFIYGWFGLPAMGTTGAAIATVIGQAFGALAGFLFHHKHNKEVNIRLSDCRPDGHIILDIYRIGFPSILMVGIGSLTNYLMNRILMAFTSTAVALYGAYFKLQSFFFMPVFGLNNGIVPGKKNAFTGRSATACCMPCASLLSACCSLKRSPVCCCRRSRRRSTCLPSAFPRCARSPSISRSRRSASWAGRSVRRSARVSIRSSRRCCVRSWRSSRRRIFCR